MSQSRKFIIPWLRRPRRKLDVKPPSGSKNYGLPDSWELEPQRRHNPRQREREKCPGLPPNLHCVSAVASRCPIQWTGEATVPLQSRGGVRWDPKTCNSRPAWDSIITVRIKWGITWRHPSLGLMHNELSIKVCLFNNIALPTRKAWWLTYYQIYLYQAKLLITLFVAKS